MPNDLDLFSAVRQALGQLIHSVAQAWLRSPIVVVNPKQALEVFLKQDPEGNLDRIYAAVFPAPVIKQAKSKLLQARRTLAFGKARPLLL